MVLVDVIVSLKKDPVSVSKIKCFRYRTARESFNTFDDGIGHWIIRPLSTFDLFASGQIHQFVSALLVPGRSENNRWASACDHAIGRMRFFVSFDVAPEKGSAVFLVIQLVSVDDFTWR